MPSFLESSAVTSDEIQSTVSLGLSLSPDVCATRGYRRSYARRRRPYLSLANLFLSDDEVCNFSKSASRDLLTACGAEMFPNQYESVQAWAEAAAQAQHQQQQQQQHQQQQQYA